MSNLCKTALHFIFSTLQYGLFRLSFVKRRSQSRIIKNPRGGFKNSQISIVFASSANYNIVNENNSSRAKETYSMKEIIRGYYKGERPLFHEHDLKIVDTIFDEGESPLKESRDIELYGLSLIHISLPQRDTLDSASPFACALSISSCVSRLLSSVRKSFPMQPFSCS